MAMEITVSNLMDGETVYQRSILVAGKCAAVSRNTDYIGVLTSDNSGKSTWPYQTWPLEQGEFKAFCILSPGRNILTFKHEDLGNEISNRSLTLTYIPMLQTPPLYLAILVAKDSPLLIDCPSVKRGRISTAHSDLNAAIEKFRMAAYMWQAAIAYEMREGFLGRRTFRLEEEWGVETLTMGRIVGSLVRMQSTAKIHLVRTEKTVAELRRISSTDSIDGNDRLADVFINALREYGGPFAFLQSPTVAGIVLDSISSSVHAIATRIDVTKNGNKPPGISLAMFGSHWVSTWPRFVEEITSCLLDTSLDERSSKGHKLWEVCSTSQDGCLTELGKAFGATVFPTQSARSPQNWIAIFLSYSSNETLGLSSSCAKSCWDLGDMLSFRHHPHFHLPDDQPLSAADANSVPDIQIKISKDEEGSEVMIIDIKSPTGLSRIMFNDIEVEDVVLWKRSMWQTTPGRLTRWVMNMYYECLAQKHDTKHPLRLEVLSTNGKRSVVEDLWEVFNEQAEKMSFIRIPGSRILIYKQSIKPYIEKEIGLPSWSWAALLSAKGNNGEGSYNQSVRIVELHLANSLTSVKRASWVEVWAGDLLDGVKIYFDEKGHKNVSGPLWKPTGEIHRMGGGNHSVIILEDVSVSQIVLQLRDTNELNGMKFHLSNGSSEGHFNTSGSIYKTLDPPPGHQIIGFYGTNSWGRRWNCVQEFGILTVQKDVKLPMAIYEMDELKNTNGGTGERPVVGS